MDAQMSDRFLLEDECLGFPFDRLPYSTLIKAEPHPPALPTPPPCVPTSLCRPRYAM